MKVLTINEILKTERHVIGNGFDSLRFILASDKMGFSLHKTIIPKGEKMRWHYKHHLEACYCITGMGVLTEKSTGQSHEIIPDTCYILDSNDEHEFEPKEDTVLISIFNPPVTGKEVHEPDGSYKENIDFYMAKAKEIVSCVLETSNDYDAIEKVITILKQK